MKHYTFVILALGVLATANAFADSFTSTKLPPPIKDADYYNAGQPSPEKVELGRLLFFDKILSGNRNISCATCHHPSLGSSDGMALPFGEGPKGLGPNRKPSSRIQEAVHGRVPRNSPALFNLGAAEFDTLFHDGRVEADPNGYYEGGFITPVKWKLPKGLENPLAAQAMFPVTSPVEMAGQKGENEIADAASLSKAAGPNGIWDLLAKRLQAIPEYVERFQQSFPNQVATASDITFVHAANAIAAFEAQAFRADNSRFDQYLDGDRNSLDKAEKRGMDLFYGKASCVSCHSGKFQTDHDFHAIAMPQIGPGKNHGQDGDYWRASGHRGFLEDWGRGRVTMRPEDNFKFRTPSLRNVAITGPWGHSGAYDSLEAVVRHHLDPQGHLESYQPEHETLPAMNYVAEVTADGPKLSQAWVDGSRLEGVQLSDYWVQSNDKLRNEIAQANELVPQSLSDHEVDDIVAFLGSLTDFDPTTAIKIVPESVPSGLPVED